MGQNAISITATRAAKRAWWDVLRPDDPRYPRSRALAALRTIGRIAWLPVTIYLGSAATNLVTALSTQGVAATMNLDGLTSALQIQHVLTLAGRSPVAAVVILVLLAALAFLIRQSQLDTRREAAVLRMREMLRLMEQRAARTMTAESLRDDLRSLELELAADSSAVTRAADQAANRAVDQLNPLLAERLARLAAISEMLSRDLGAQAMWDELMSRQMTAWQRRQRLWSAGMGAATIAIGGVLPVLLGAGTLGL